MDNQLYLSVLRRILAGSDGESGYSRWTRSICGTDSRICVRAAAGACPHRASLAALGLDSPGIRSGVISGVKGVEAFRDGYGLGGVSALVGSTAYELDQAALGSSVGSNRRDSSSWLAGRRNGSRGRSRR